MKIHQPCRIPLLAFALASFSCAAFAQIDPGIAAAQAASDAAMQANAMATQAAMQATADAQAANAAMQLQIQSVNNSSAVYAPSAAHTIKIVETSINPIRFAPTSSTCQMI